jgi:hypothetical protein
MLLARPRQRGGMGFALHGMILIDWLTTLMGTRPAYRPCCSTTAPEGCTFFIPILKPGYNDNFSAGLA